MLCAIPRRPVAKITIKVMDIGNNQKLLNYQNEYLTTGSESAWASLWLLSLEICKNIIWGEIRRKGIFLSEMDFEDKVHNAALYVLRRYKTRPGYRIEKAFITALALGCKHSLYYQTMESKIYNAAIRLGDPKNSWISTDKVIDIKDFDFSLYK